MESALRLPTDPSFRLIETFLWTPTQGIQRRDLHVARLANAALRLGIAMPDPGPLLDQISAKCAQRVRLTLDAKGRLDIAMTDQTPMASDAVWRIGLATELLNANDPWLSVKSTNRRIYDRTRASLDPGIDEVIFLNDRHEVCEGTITNIFVNLGHGLVTPPCASGVLPGVLRADLLAQNRVTEQVLYPDQLGDAHSIYLGNSLRGLIRAELATS